MSALGIHATERPWRELLVGRPLRLQPQQLQRQKGRVRTKVVKVLGHLPRDAAKAVKVGTRPGHQVAQGLSAMNGRRPESATDPAANMPTHLVVGGAPVEDLVRPRGEERAKAATSPEVLGPAVPVLPNLVTSTRGESAKMATNASLHTLINPLCPLPVKNVVAPVNGAKTDPEAGPLPLLPSAPNQKAERVKRRIALLLLAC